MLAYEVYYDDEINSDSLIGILPERRKHLERITEDSIMERVKGIIGERLDIHRISFVRVMLDEGSDDEASRSRAPTG